MADLATLKSRIASELHRSDLTTQIAYAIEDSVRFYQSKPFALNQLRGTFNTVAGQEFYSDLTDVASIDAITVLVNARKAVLEPWSYLRMEHINSTTNTQSQPWAWAWYDEQIRLYPVPDAAYPLTVSYTQKVGVPATDGDSNIWTTEAEELIRNAAKKRICREYTHDDQMGVRAEMAEREALARLNQNLNQLSTGSLRGSM